MIRRLPRRPGFAHVRHVLFWASESPRDPEVFDPAAREEVRGRTIERLEGLVGEIEASGGAVEGSRLRVGRPDAQIVAEAEEAGAGLIVMGSRGFGRVRRALTGSVSDSVVRHVHCPVMVVRKEKELAA
jgi:nucleotide-binding universal stress UspA family protein